MTFKRPMNHFCDVRSTDAAIVKAAKLVSCHNGMVGDKARGYLDGLAGVPARTDAAHQESYDDGWLTGAIAREEGRL